MSTIGYVIWNIMETLLRMLPIPKRTGLIKIGNPDRNSPVFLTCNYHLTVERVKRALRGIDCYLLVANSRGINVWCASAGGLLTTHEIISVLKVTGIENLVDHRNVILPQLAATGVEARVVKKKTGWNVVWGPIRATDIPEFMENKFKKTQFMREVNFPFNQRVEMAVAWAFPISIVLNLVLIFLWREAILPLTVLVWVLSFSIFTLFPHYEKILSYEGRRIGFVFFDFGRGGFQLILWIILTIGLLSYGFIRGEVDWMLILRWSFVFFVTVLMVSIDLKGSTPVYKSSLHEDRFFEITLDEEKCKGVGICEVVCPRNCYEVDRKRHLAKILRAEKCVKCGACIVQCPFDAIHFETLDGRKISPEIIRKFKLNMMGKRLVTEEKNTPLNR